MKRIHANRLLKLAAFLRTVPRERFDYSVIADSDTPGVPPSPTACGTVACAFGHMPNVPALKRLGVRYERERDFADKWSVVTDKSPSGCIGDVAREIFGLTVEESDYLFLSHEGLPPYKGVTRSMHEATPTMVARKIEDFVAKAVAS